jgi:hypothetical protein
MSTASLTSRVYAASLVAAFAAMAVVPSAGLAQEPSDGLRAVPSALLTIDQNRSTVVDRIVAEWGREIAASNAGISVEQLRTMLHGMRSDYLLAATVSGSLEGLRSVIAGSLIGTAPVKREATKALGDVARDVVYTPVTPCRILDTRYAGAGPLLGGQQRSYLAANPTGSFVGQGGDGSNCGIPIKPAAVLANFIVFGNGAGPAFLTAWQFGRTTPTASTLNWNSAGQQVANAIILPLCTGGACTYDFSAQASEQTELVVDVMGYFAAPLGTPVQCNDVVGPITPIPVSSDTVVVLPACASGFTRTGAKCSGTANVPAGYLVEVNSTGCVFRNLSAAAPYNATAASTCCQVPGR